VNQVLLPPRLGGQPSDKDLFLKWLAFTFGWAGLREYVEGRELSPQFRSRLTGVFRDEVLRRSLEATRRIVPTAENAVQVADLQMRMLDLDQRRGQPDDSALAAGINKVLASVRIGVADPVPIEDEPRPKTTWGAGPGN
jgi:hypothetical protein